MLKRLHNARQASSFVAGALMVRAMRNAGLHHTFREYPAIIGIVGVRKADFEAMSEAIEFAFEWKEWSPRSTATNVHDWTDVPASKRSRMLESLLFSIRQGKRVFVFFDKPESVPAEFIGMCDGIATIGPIGPDIVGAAFKRVASISVPASALELAATIPLGLLDVAIRRGVGPHQAVAKIRKLAASVGQSTKSTDSVPIGKSRDTLRLEDLSGLGEAKDWGISLAADMNDYRAGRVTWSELDRGALVSGPPGTGKTTFALALGRTCNLPVHIHSLAAWQSTGYLNSLLKAMREAFEKATADAPCILFVDELDSFGDRAKVSGHNAQYSREVINAFLECLDGASNRDGVVVVGATNYPDLIDPAIRRPGRLDRHLVISLPGASSRVGILRHHLGDFLADADLLSVAEAMEGASGADIEQVVRDAKRNARRDNGRALEYADLLRTLPKPVVLSDAAFRRACVHEAGHFVVGHALSHVTGSVPTEARVFREVRTTYGGATDFERQDGFDRTRATWEAEIAVLLAGAAAEDTMLDSRGDGSGGSLGSDLHKATQIALHAEATFGLGDSFLYLGDESQSDPTWLLRSDANLRGRIAKTLDVAFEHAIAVLKDRREQLETVIEGLYDTGRISTLQKLRN